MSKGRPQGSCQLPPGRFCRYRNTPPLSHSRRLSHFLPLLPRSRESARHAKTSMLCSNGNISMEPVMYRHSSLPLYILITLILFSILLNLPPVPTRYRSLVGFEHFAPHDFSSGAAKGSHSSHWINGQNILRPGSITADASPNDAFQNDEHLPSECSGKVASLCDVR